MSTNIIEESVSGAKTVPDEYAIKCIGIDPFLSNKQGRALKFSFVTPAFRLVGDGFVQMYGIANIPMNTEGFVILKNDLSSIAEIYFRNNEELIYGGLLTKCENSYTTYEPPQFSKVHYYSERNIEAQKSDEDVPNWLKEFAKQRGASVAYFEF